MPEELNTNIVEYKIGDLVVITQGTSDWVSEMNRFVGKVVKITECFKNYHNNGYNIKFDLAGARGWVWNSHHNHFKLLTQKEIENMPKYEYPELHYLPEDYNGLQDEVINHEGYTCLRYKCCEIEDVWYHLEIDEELITNDEFKGDYILAEDSVEARCNNRLSTKITHVDNTITLEDGEYTYIKYYVDRGDCNHYIVLLHNGEYCSRDDANWSDVTNEWYHENEDLPEEEEDEDSLFCYHSNNTKDFSNDSKFKIGFEIEKSQMPEFDFDKYDILNTTGFVLEKDSSVDDGFELISPILDLYDQKILSHFEKVKNFIDIPHINNAGGHINVSIQGKTANETLIALNGWLPLIYALYKGRANGTYSKAKKVADLIYDTDKYQSVRTKNNGVVEFRIISAVREFGQLEFRINLFKIMFENLGISFLEVLQLATDPKHKLYKLFTKDIYKDLEKFNNLVSTAIKFERDLEGIYTINQIEKATKKLKKLKTALKIPKKDSIDTGSVITLGSLSLPLRSRTASNVPITITSSSSSINYLSETDLDSIIL